MKYRSFEPPDNRRDSTFLKGRGKVRVDGKVSKFFKYLGYFWKRRMDYGRGEMKVKMY
jgi:hypothetical protein